MSKAEAGVQVIAKMEDKVVAVKQDNIVATAFILNLALTIDFTYILSSQLLISEIAST